MFLPAANRMRHRATRRHARRSSKRKLQQTRRRHSPRSKRKQRGGQQLSQPTLSVTYDPNLQVAGQQLTVQQTEAAPTLTFSSLDPNETYALVMHDPDAPHPSYVHWILKDITAANPNGTTVLPYQGPNPPPHPPYAPVHRYILILFVQPLNFALPTERTGFDAAALPSPVATQQFTVESPLAF